MIIIFKNNGFVIDITRRLFIRIFYYPSWTYDIGYIFDHELGISTIYTGTLFRTIKNIIIDYREFKKK